MSFLTSFCFNPKSMFIQKLCQIGLTQAEAKLYLELLKLGPQAVSIIANKVKINRSTAYCNLKSLERKGFVASFLNGNNMTYFSANDPSCLVAYLDGKKSTYDYYRQEFLGLIPEFRELRGNFQIKKPVVGYFEGFEGIKNLMNDSLVSGVEICEYLPLHKWLNDEKFLDFGLEYSHKRIDERKIKLRCLVPDRPEVHKFFQKNYDLNDDFTNVTYIPDEKFLEDFNNQVMIYGNKVSTIHFNDSGQYGILVESEDIAAMERAIFEMLWKGSNKI